MIVIDTHIQLVFNELLDSKLINNEIFRKKSFKTESDIKFLRKNNANNVLNFLKKEPNLKSWEFYAYGFCCHSNILNRLQNDLILEETRNYDNLFPVAVINPWDISESEIKWIIKNFYGVHIKPEWINFDLDKINIQNKAFSIIEKANLPIFLHMGYIYNMNLVKLNYVNFLNNILSSYPDLRLILEHCGGGLFLAETYEPWKKMLKNVCYSISAPRSPLLIESLFRTVNIEKICFGSDYPFCDGKTPLDYYNEVLSIIKKTEVDSSRISALFKKWLQ